MTRLPVVAAVPNYNMGEQLASQLPQLIEGGYDAIFVLDDGSTDGSREVTQAISTDIHFVAGAVNKGAGANRNRILDELDKPAILHFIDADTTVETPRIAEVISDAMPAEPVGFLGGLVYKPEGFQSLWNFGPRQCLWSDAGAIMQDHVGHLLKKSPQDALAFREKHQNLLQNWPNPFEEPVRRPVFWVIESNMVIKSDVFKALGGFDEKLREHEIQDLAIRMAKLGLDRHFDPSFAVTQTDVDVRHYNRQKAQLKTELQIQRKHGLRHYALPGGKIKPAP